MGREKKKAPAASRLSGSQARKAKHDRARGFTDGIWQNLNALKEAPKLKHKSYFESVENVDKKPKLDYEITTNREPPPGLDFIPLGHPDLTKECKELSRTQGALYFIVSDSKDDTVLEHHMNRVGYHFRQSIIEEAKETLAAQGLAHTLPDTNFSGQPEAIPKSQAEINIQADAFLRDLFPRIPNTDRVQIISHAFKKDGKFQGEYKVGMAKELTLARRVQLAALAHIRHTRTRYDDLLKESNWANARKAVEKPCLDVIVKWRGDEETGRDQLDEILREVIEISDEDDDSGDESSGIQSPGYAFAERSAAASPMVMSAPQTPIRVVHPPTGGLLPSSVTAAMQDPMTTPPRPRGVPRSERKNAASARRAAKAAQRFKRYAAVADAIADEGRASMQRQSPREVDYAMSNGEAARPLVLHREPSVPLLPPVPVTYGGYPVEYVHQASSAAIHHITAEAGPTRSEGPFYINCAPSTLDTSVRQPENLSPRLLPVASSRPPAEGRANSLLAPPELVRASAGHGLQDYLVPSVEPPSPKPYQQPFYSLRQRPEEQLRTPVTVIHQNDRCHAERERSNGLVEVAESSGGQPERRRVVTYFPEDYERPSRPTLVSLSRSDATRDRAETRYAYHSGSRPREAPNRASVGHRHTPSLDRQQRRILQEPAPISTRSNPIMLDGDRSYDAYTTRHMPTHEEHIPFGRRENMIIRHGNPMALPIGQHAYIQEPVHLKVHGVTASHSDRQELVLRKENEIYHLNNSPMAANQTTFDSPAVHQRPMPDDTFSRVHRHDTSLGSAPGPIYVDSRHAVAHYDLGHERGHEARQSTLFRAQQDASGAHQIQQPIYVGPSQPQLRRHSLAQVHQQNRDASRPPPPREVICLDD